MATIETMLLFLLAFLYADRPYYDHERVMCMAQYLINVQAKNRLEHKGLLKRFNINCYGKEKTIVEIRSEKASKYEELKDMKDSKEYNKYFFKYTPVKRRKSALKEERIKPSYTKRYNYIINTGCEKSVVNMKAQHDAYQAKQRAKLSQKAAEQASQPKYQQS